MPRFDWGKAPEDRFFVRLLDKNGQTVLEELTSPRPEGRLVAGQLLIGEATVTVPAELPAGAYQLQLGFYIPVVEAGELIFEVKPAMTEVIVQP